ncbi:MAG: tetratricopeptide repeat protein [Treponema sp.]|nr:tetratricopeptide repeat protein [Treponema sp.]MBQ7167612.1 tetratricopeptide repeat protein [Treponema sp.]
MKIESVLAVVLASAVLFASCSPSYNSVKRMQRLEEGVANPTTKEELEEAIKKYEARAMDLVLTEAQTGMWYKLLGTRYLDERMYRKAYEAFRKALLYYPDNAHLYYYIAICAGYIANSAIDYSFSVTGQEILVSASERDMLLELSESSYKQALEIDPKYYRAMYGIGVLYVFELDQPADAIPYLERFLDTQKRDSDAMFVLARAYYQTYQFDKAVVLYDKIIALNPNAEKTAEAKANKKVVLDAQYAN